MSTHFITGNTVVIGLRPEFGFHKTGISVSSDDFSGPLDAPDFLCAGSICQWDESVAGKFIARPRWFPRESWN